MPSEPAWRGVLRRYRGFVLLIALWTLVSVASSINCRLNLHGDIPQRLRVDRVLMLEPAVELAQHRCRIGRSFITVRARLERVLEEVAIPRRRQEFAPVQGHQAGSSWPMHLRP